MRLQFQCARIDSNQGARSSDDPFIVYYPAPSRAPGFIIERHPPRPSLLSKAEPPAPPHYTATNNATTSITAVAAMKASALNSSIRRMPRRLHVGQRLAMKKGLVIESGKATRGPS
jgi:hypothetical protein